MELRRGKLSITHAQEKDCKQLSDWWNDGEVMAHAGFPYGLHTSEEETWKKVSTDSDEKGRRLIIRYEETPIGEMSYFNNHDGTVNIGIKICEKDYQEKGYGRILLSMLIRYLFDQGYEKIVLDTDLENKRAQHVYELLGFKRLRVNQDSWKNQLGELRSSVDYELVEEDFHAF